MIIILWIQQVRNILDKKKKYIYIGGIIILIVGVIEIFSLCSQSKPLKNGGKYSHLYHASGKIIDKNNRQKKIEIVLNQNEEYFTNPQIWIDCSNEYSSFENFALNEEIVFTFFLPSSQDFPLTIDTLEINSIKKLDSPS